MFKGYSYWDLFVFGLFIIIFGFMSIGYVVLYSKCMFIDVSDLPGYCLSIL